VGSEIARWRAASVLLCPAADQHDARTHGQRLRCLLAAAPVGQLLLFGKAQSERRKLATIGHEVPPAYIGCKDRKLFKKL